MKKRYKLSKQTIFNLTLKEGDPYHFRIGFERIVDGKKHLISQKKCPIVTMIEADILETENESSQQYLSIFKSFTRKIINGARNDSFFIFEDVTESTSEKDVTINFDNLIQ